MVNVGEKAPSVRTAAAAARVLVNRETFALIRSGGMKKGDVLAVAQLRLCGLDVLVDGGDGVRGLVDAFLGELHVQRLELDFF